MSPLEEEACALLQTENKKRKLTKNKGCFSFFSCEPIVESNLGTHLSPNIIFHSRVPSRI